MKKWYGVMLALLMVALVFCQMSALAEEEAEVFTEGDYQYTVDELGNATISGYTGDASKLTVPGTLGGYPVTAIGRSAFYRCGSLT